MSNLYLGFDAGTQSVKVAVYDQQWKCLAQHALPTTLRYPRPGWVQMDADEYVAIAVECIRRCTAEIKGKGYDAAAKELQILADHWAEKT
ncbi:MAG: hypothetical protein HUK26_04510, partial [Duodenibacillus sp.]|nr:hypothetical protein [Duodenibacillus sp.]